jgi:hypothetical protein
MLRMCVCMHSSFVENHPIQILEDGPLISVVVLSHRTARQVTLDHIDPMCFLPLVHVLACML